MSIPNIQGKPCLAQYTEKGHEAQKAAWRVAHTLVIFISSFQPNHRASESVMWFKEEGTAGSLQWKKLQWVELQQS